MALAVSGCSGPLSPDDEVNEIGFSMILEKPVGYSRMCDRVENMKVLERIDRTAGKLKHPAYVIGYRFDCLTSLAGKSTDTLYIGFVHNTDKGGWECIHWNKDKNEVLANTWSACGGLN